MFQRDGVTQVHRAVVLDPIEGQVQNLYRVVVSQESGQASRTVPCYSVTVEVKMFNNNNYNKLLL